MTQVSIRRLAVLALAAVLLSSLAGCWNPFAPDEGKPKPRPPADFRLRTTPANVMHNMQLAYVYMDAEEYLDCLSEDFIFFANEDDVGNGVPESWEKDTERNVHENMFSDSPPDPALTVESIQLTLTLTNRDSIPSAIPEHPWDYIFTESVILYVNLYTGLTYYANAPSEYRLRVDQDQVGPNGEQLWEVYEWSDLDNTKRGALQDPGVENTTVAELKAKYLD
ncbi:MAG: hypothetical protein JXB46_00380 [Candidatus Eisenbacteria bacterium]|nr:hypothetical protein [Candidatus Eisenbacteria bacterium]